MFQRSADGGSGPTARVMPDPVQVRLAGGEQRPVRGEVIVAVGGTPTVIGMGLLDVVTPFEATPASPGTPRRRGMVCSRSPSSPCAVAKVPLIRHRGAVGILATPVKVTSPARRPSWGLPRPW